MEIYASNVPSKRLVCYQAKCGASLEEWEGSGWMRAQDPYGWFQWYCRCGVAGGTLSLSLRGVMTGSFLAQVLPGPADK